MLKKQVISMAIPKAIGPYSPAIKIGDFIYLSGMLPVNVEGTIETTTIEEQTKQVMNNIIAILDEMDLKTYHIIKTTVYLSDLDDFDKMNIVYGSYFDEPYPARSCIEVSRLFKNAKIVIDAVIIDTLKYETDENPCSGCKDLCDDCSV